ncbi:PorP/SprF family type IX secretion system membrane protein [Pararcticibacter amylolyticus]|uniref:Type IX secretion system membrane protein PorP/SprF n=1 Tax=Pararcticibacter amylolyticus TaxID=2173175 RepID=A0A2U2PM00_9SPHI|nr:PorP/SprF family type IX secretion system membrane protein [Pararcticibacter amylolyticus]PWG82435.1 hypothetical protein DDR33_00780 [Pararcticibacter amylolyticus]
MAVYLSIRCRLWAAILFSLVFANASKAQLNQMTGSYFSNQYLSNPAMAGLNRELVLNMAMSKQWENIPGGPKIQSFTADYGVNEKLGLGVNIYNEKSGLISNTRLLASYAYHLPLNNHGSRLSFGISAGYSNERLDGASVNGESNDAVVGKFNYQKSSIDGDFGAAYQNNRLTLQFAVPKMKSLFQSDDYGSDAYQTAVYSAASYKFKFANTLDGMSVTPLVAFRSIRDSEDIADMGANFTFANEAVNLIGIYHTTKSISLGLGATYNKLFTVTAMYTSDTGVLSSYTNGTFELGLRLHMLRAK